MKMSRFSDCFDTRSHFRETTTKKKKGLKETGKTLKKPETERNGNERFPASQKIRVVQKEPEINTRKSRHRESNYSTS